MTLLNDQPPLQPLESRHGLIGRCGHTGKVAHLSVGRHDEQEDHNTGYGHHGQHREQDIVLSMSYRETRP